MQAETDSRSDLAPADIRAALDRLVASDLLRASPQLAAFLRFVVEATLRGDSDRIKGYTIAIEALGRSDDFDPQSDPIVRVEAARLRRAIERHYAGPGADDPVVIDLPRGTYVPTFRRRPCAVALPEVAVPEVSAPDVSPSETAAAAEAVPQAPASSRGRRLAFAVALLAVVGSAAAAVIGPSLRHPAPSTVAPDPLRADRPAARSQRMGGGMPVLFVQPFETSGTSGSPAISLTGLRAKLRDALAGFDEVHVLSDMPEGPVRETALPGDAPRSAYRLGGSAEFHPDGSTSLTFGLIDSADGTVVWSRSFERLPAAADPESMEKAIIREVVTTLAQRYGVIPARERAKRARGDDIDARYACLLEAQEFWRAYDPALHDGVRACLTRETSLDPSFAAGWAALATIYLREFYSGPSTRRSESPALDRALEIAQHAVALKPESARAQQALLDIHFARGEFASALSAGEKAMELNPYDMYVLADYALRLVALGEVEKGSRLLRQARANITVRPEWLSFGLFLTDHLAGDVAAEKAHANQLTNDKLPAALIARALAATAGGDRDRAARKIAKLIELRPAWRDNPRGEIDRLFVVPSLVERLTRDLAAAGLVIAE
jgi:tetratricopeptide (TPR) repeat protein